MRSCIISGCSNGRPMVDQGRPIADQAPVMVDLW